MNKVLIPLAFLVGAALATSAFAQSASQAGSAGTTRQAVRARLADAVQAGWLPDADYRRLPASATSGRSNPVAQGGSMNGMSYGRGNL